MAECSDMFVSCNNDIEKVINKWDNVALHRQKKVRNEKYRAKGTWDLKTVKMSEKLTKLSALYLPYCSQDILSEAIVSHQINEIVKVVKTEKNSISLHAKVNLKDQTYCDLETNDVMIKIFTQNNHWAPNIRAAEYYQQNLDVIKKDATLKEVWKNKNVGTIKCYEIFRVLLNSVVIIGFYTAPRDLTQIIKDDPNQIKRYYKEILELLYRHKNDDLCEVFDEFAPLNNFEWYRGAWKINSPINQSCRNKKAGKFAHNVVCIMKAFQNQGMFLEELKSEFFNVFEKEDKSGQNQRIIQSVEDSFLSTKKR